MVTTENPFIKFFFAKFIIEMHSFIEIHVENISWRVEETKFIVGSLCGINLKVKSSASLMM